MSFEVTQSASPDTDAPAIPARDAASEFPSFDRADRLISLLSSVGVEIKGQNVADLGTGYGFLALGAARAGAATVQAVDANPDRLARVAERAETAGADVRCLQANLLEPVRELRPASLAFLVGVVEYAGLWDHTRPVQELQRQVFATAFEALGDGGTLVFGSKNRIWPRFLWDDVHTRRPLLNVLPRSWADAMSNRMYGKPYRHHIHSPWKWREMLRSVGFRKVETYLPHFSYQFPLLLERKPSFHDVGRIRDLGLSEAEREAALNRLWWVKSVLMASGATLRVPLAQSVVLKATK